MIKSIHVTDYFVHGRDMRKSITGACIHNYQSIYPKINTFSGKAMTSKLYKYCIVIECDHV